MEQILLQPVSAKKLQKGGPQPRSFWLQCSQNPTKEQDPQERNRFE